LNDAFAKLVALAAMSLPETQDMLYYNNMDCTGRRIQFSCKNTMFLGFLPVAPVNQVPFFIRAIPGAPPSDQRYALLKNTPGNFL
jgi:hypothetical protein